MSPISTTDHASSTDRTAPAEPTAPTGMFRSPTVRLGVSLFLVYHLAAVLLEPLATPPQFAGPPSVVPELVRPMFRPYATALSLDHAYKFFAPNPGESHLVRYDLYFADGTKRINQADQWFPDRKRDWPRLLYHRYFMITEFLPDGRNFDNWNFEPEARLAPPGTEMIPPPGDDAPAGPPTGTFDPQSVAVQGQVPGQGGPPREPTAQVYARGIASYLARKHGAVRVDLFHVVHRLSHPQEILEGRKLDAPDTYRERLLISYNAPDMKPGDTKQSAAKIGTKPLSEGRR